MSAVIQIVIFAWIVHAVLGLGLSAPIIARARTRVAWSWLDLLAAIIPFGVWFALAGFCGVVPKNIPNILFEPLILSLGLPAAAAVRVGLRERLSHAALLAALLVLLSCLGVGIYFAIPTIGE